MDSLHAFSDIEGFLTYLAPQYIDRVEKAFVFAKNAHQGQARISGEAYISHPLAVASILAKLKLDHDTIIAGLLHDVVEDTGIELSKIIDHFGEDVGLIVNGVTKISKVKYERALTYQTENYRKMFMAMANDIRVIFVKLADRLHNMRTCQVMSQRSKRRIARETLEIYAPLAKRLGMHNLSLELEELGFAACYPSRYAVLMEHLFHVNSGQADVLTHLSHQIHTQAKAAGIHVLDIASREKQLYGIYRKMKIKKARFSDLLDVYALRICVGSVGECYALLGIVHGLYKPKVRHLKDYIAAPKQNGYQSIHTVLFGPYGLPIEIQIRTTEMHLVATKGVAAHWIYKSGTSMFNQQKQQKWFRRLVKAQEVCSGDADYLQLVKHQIYSEEVYVLTPKGKVLELKKGATVLDMAYQIHTDVGNQSVYARVDRLHAPLNQVLRNGQVVEIIVDSQAVPNESWLEFVRTSKARSGIRQALKDAKILSARRLGMKKLINTLNVRGIEAFQTETIHKMMTGLSYKDESTLYESIYYGVNQVEDMASLYEVHMNKISPQEKPSMVIDGIEDGAIELSQCCYPIKGDRVSGIIGDGAVQLHRRSCRILARSSEDVVEMKWGAVEYWFDCIISVSIVGVHANIAYVVSTLIDMKAVIINLNINDEQDTKNMMFKIKVSSLEHLALVIQSLNQVKMVNMVKRELRCGLLLLEQD